LYLTIARAELTRDTEWLGKMDPYCVLTHRGTVLKTSVKQAAGKKPIWNEHCTFKDLKISDQLTINVMEEDIGKDDDEIGSTSIEFSKLCVNGLELWVEIFYKNKRSGKVLFKSQWAPNYDLIAPTEKKPKNEELDWTIQ